MSIKKHVGVIKSTEQRCVVVFMQLPEDKTKALVINTESLTPRFEQMIMDIVNSAEGQEANTLADVFYRRTVPETGRSVLEECHVQNLLRAESIDNVIMLPRPNNPFPLRDILTQMGQLTEIDQTQGTEQTQEEYNHHAANQQAASADERIQMANNFLFEAKMLEEEAQKKREMAYQYAPSLRPKARTRTPVAPVAEAPATVTGETTKVKRTRRRRSASTNV